MLSKTSETDILFKASSDLMYIVGYSVAAVWPADMARKIWLQRYGHQFPDKEGY